MNPADIPLTQCKQCGHWDRTTACKFCGVKKLVEEIAALVAFTLGGLAFLHVREIAGWFL